MSGTVTQAHPLLLAPFGLLLLSIATLPLLWASQWERHYGKLCGGLAIITCGYYVFGLRATDRVLHAAGEYLSFLVVMGSFFVVAGAIHLHVPRPATPLLNVSFLFLGSVLANCIGTIGASMLLLRPFLHMNHSRCRPIHVAFFIFTVSNLGGALLPIGPPLFLGYISGVPFTWPAVHCFPHWLTAMAALLLIFFVADALLPATAVAQPAAVHFRCYGTWNFVALLVLLLALVFLPLLMREVVMLTVAATVYLLTPERIFNANEFRWQPFFEVALIFLGIFGTMIPVLDLVQLHAPKFHLATDARFYWSTGVLSGVLDNAPTYLMFITAGLGLAHLNINNAHDVAQFAANSPRQLSAISVAATFFGGLTYIGNSPNLLVRAIAVSRRAPAPDFVAFSLKYAAPILLPVLVLVGLIFFRG